MNLDPALLEIIVCPDCRGALAVDEEASELVCTACGLAYPGPSLSQVAQQRVGLAQRVGVVEEAVVEDGHQAGSELGRASSTSSTGMSSRTG